MTEAIRTALEALTALLNAQTLPTYGDASDFVWPKQEMRRPGETAWGWICEKHGLGYTGGCVCCRDEFAKYRQQQDREARHARDLALQAAGELARTAIATLTAEMERPAGLPAAIALQAPLPEVEREQFVAWFKRVEDESTNFGEHDYAMAAWGARAKLAPAERPAPAPVAWISVDDRLPPRHTDVWCFNRDGEVFRGRICAGMHKPFFTLPRGDGSPSNTAPDWIDVTHWMLPAAPQAKDQT